MNIVTNLNQKVECKILLGENYESFDLNLKDWTLENYIHQWKSAARYSLDNREISAFFKSYESSKKGVIKTLSLYTIIPIEMTYSIEECLSKGEDSDFFITERFMFVTENKDSFFSEDDFMKIKESFYEYFPIYYLDLDNLNRFYLYLSDKVENVSKWKVSKKSLETILKIV